MIGLLIRLAVGRYVSGFWLGLILFLAGIGLSAASLLAVITVGGSTTIIFGGLIVGGLIRMVLSAPALLSSSRRSVTAMPSGGPSMAPMPSYFAPPAEMPPGFCWQCGGKVKLGYAICLHCGASQGAADPVVSEASRLSGFDTSNTGMPRYDGPVPAATPWQPPQQAQQGAYPPNPYQQGGGQQGAYQPNPYQQGGGQSRGPVPGERQGGRNAPRGGPPPGQDRR